MFRASASTQKNLLTSISFERADTTTDQKPSSADLWSHLVQAISFSSCI